MRTLAIVLLCLVVVANYGTVTALRCIQCQSVNATCYEPILDCSKGSADVSLQLLQVLKPSLVVGTKGDKFRCFEVDVKKEAVTVYIKGCIYDDVDVCAGETNEGEQGYCERCTSDECNAATSLVVNFGLLLGLLLAVKAYWM
ncbi:uncharacterized protein LOC131682158 [Topomyia yanbarensis]|uniref:uncharacterized protein LOC131682158 n=1 Tax=Topomyia yanbarensis TaxID=2498891 RepID=UPI00273AA8EF|nr:uncharacterized protein LOC131682158 [Topomyia yanbarensis]